MIKQSLLASVFALVQAITLKDDPVVIEPFELVTGTTDDILEHLNEEVGNFKWVPPVENRGSFETDLNSILADFYDKAGEAWGTGDYGEFYEHGGSGDPAWDFGIGVHGVPVYDHSHFWYNGDLSNGKAAEFEPNYITVDYPEQQAYSYTVEPTIQWTRLQQALPDQYQRPQEHYDHLDHLGLTDEWEGFHIDDYLGSPGHDHRHYNFDNYPEFHNHHLHDPYATERRYQPHPEEYFVPVVVDVVPKVQEEEPEPEAPEEPEADYGVPLDLGHYLSGDHYSHHHSRPRYPAPAPSVVLNPPGLDLEPVTDDLSFLFDHRPHASHHHHHKHHGHHSRSYW